MPNLIQIKRSLTSAAPESLANGELAYTAAVDTLYIGSNGAVVPIGGRRTPGILSANQALIANSTSGIDKVIVANLVPTSIYANGSFGTSGQILTSNGTAVYWEDIAGTGTVTQIDSGSGLVGGPITGTGTLSVLANSGIISNTTGVFVNSNNGIIANTTGVFVKANNGISVTADGVFAVGANGLFVTDTGLNIGAGNGVVVDADSIRILTGSTLVVNATGVHVNNDLHITDLSLSGNLTVLGTTTTIDTQTLVVNDSIIELARNNLSDLIDIGFFGQYDDGSNRYVGLIWDTSENAFELFANTTTAPTTTLDTGAVGYVRATLKSFLDTGAFVASPTAVNITANSTVSSAIVANTLSLSTALSGTNGGTGKSTITSEALLVGNTTNGYKELTLGVDGYVLQSNGSAVVYATLDGGSF